jgi:tetratricopeptide (TPR) repeat protein
MSVVKTAGNSTNTSIDYYGYNIDGVSKADLGQFQEALDYFSKAIENDPYNFVSYFNRASIKMRLGDIEGARIDFKKSEVLDSTDYYA